MRKRLIAFMLGFAGLMLVTLSIALNGGSATAQPDAHAYRAVVPLVVRGGSLPTTVPPPSPTAAPTQPPTSVPTVAPTPNPATVFVRNYSDYEDSLGSLWIVGEVVNPLPYPIEFVRVGVRFYGANGMLVGTDFGYSSLAVIPAGQDSPFQILVLDTPPGTTTYELVVTDFDSDLFQQVPSGLNLAVTNSYVDSFGWRHDVGTLTNTSGSTYEFAEAIVAYYDPSGRVIRVRNDYADPDALAPGETGTFDVILFDADELPITSTRTWRDAWVED